MSSTEIEMTDENRPYFEALMSLAAFTTRRNLDAEQVLVDAIQEMLRLRAENEALRSFVRYYFHSGVADMYDNETLDEMLDRARALLSGDDEEESEAQEC